MASRWKKLKLYLSSRVCAAAPPVSHDHSDDSLDPCDPLNSISPNSEPALSSRAASGRVHSLSTGSCGGGRAPRLNHQVRPTTASAPSSASLSHNSARLSRNTCSICLEAMKPGQGQALFTAECSHVFHFSCIASNVRHGNQVCPVCRAQWKDVPWQAAVDVAKVQSGRHASHIRTPSAVPRSLSRVGRLGSSNLSDEEQRRISSLLHMFDESISRRQNHPGEPDVYDDDEPLVQSSRDSSSLQASSSTTSANSDQRVILKSHAEVCAIPASESRHNFTVLVHLRAPPGSMGRSGFESSNTSAHPPDSCSRAPIDLVAVLDISGSMAGTKLTLLKQAMGFVIRNLSSADRLSVVVFSSTAKRIFALRRMGEEGQQHSLRAINSLVSTGGTNIAEGLRKGLKVLEDRKERNPVSSIMLLSDGQDTYSLTSQRQPALFLSRGVTDSRRLVPRSIRRSACHGQMQIPVHTFGFGADHDAATMHTISEVSGGTFSFVQAEEVVQDAFAQCIGGLLSVVIQDVQLTVTCSTPGVLINNIKSGSYENSILDNARHGIIKLGDLYAEEERDVLLELEIPSALELEAGNSMLLLQAGCIYKDPVSQETKQDIADELCISRPETIAEDQVLSIEVDRQRNRLRTAEVIAEARSLADRGDISSAQCNLQSAKMALENSLSARAGDHLSNVLEAELTEIQERMANQYLYERTGRAYLLSAQSSHQRQRATTRGESLDGLNHDYQTPSMVDMITQSQTVSFSELAASRALPFATARSNQGSNTDVPNSSRSLLRRASAKVRRSSSHAL